MSELSTDLELCNNAWENIISNYGNIPSTTDFTDYERVIVLVWTVTGIIENGGFQYLFESDLPGDSDLTLTIKAFESIECYEAKLLLEDVLQRILSVNDTMATKLERYLNLPKEDRDRFDSKFWSEIDSITKSLANFITRNNK